MIKLADVKEQSFRNLKDLRACLAGRKVRDYEVPIDRFSIDEGGVLCAGPVEGQMAQSALKGLLSIYHLPWQFATEECSSELLTHIIRQLGQDKRKLVRIQTVDDVVSAVMPANRQPMRHDTLVDWLGVKRPIHEATLHLSSLRITSVDRDSKEFLPGETFGYGWELLNNEDGWAPTESRQYIIRWACINGMIGLDKMSSLRRMPKSREPIFQSLERLGSVLDDVTEFKDLGNAVKWAGEKQLGPEHDAVVSYLAGRLEGKATMIALDKITVASSWYDLLNMVTSLAKTHHLDMRRRYEFEGGMLVKWFSRQGRVRPPWQKKSCQECVAWNSN